MSGEYLILDTNAIVDLLIAQGVEGWNSLAYTGREVVVLSFVQDDDMSKCSKGG